MPILEACNIRKSFDGLEAVKDFSLSLEKGKLFGLIGPNGAGKTTVFNIISGLLQPDEGKVLINGNDVTNKRADQIKKFGLSRTFQGVRVFKNFSVEENLRISCHSLINYGPFVGLFGFPRYYKQEAKLDEHISGLINEFGLTQYMKTEVGKLTYLNQRWLELACAISTNPIVLLLDEPTAGLNEQETQEYINVVENLRLNKGLSILFIEHSIQLIMRICDTIYVMDHGSLLTYGKPYEIQQNQQVIEAYLGTKTLT